MVVQVTGLKRQERIVLTVLFEMFAVRTVIEHNSDQ